MKYFTNVKTTEELKKTFKSLMMKHHPDRGGNTAICQEISAEYDKVMQNFINGFDDSSYTKNDNGYSFWESREEHSEVEKKVREAIEKIIMLDGLEIEIVGVWVWVSGDTKKHKDALKAAGFYWFNKKKMWAFAGKKSNGRGKMKIDEVRAKYGSTTENKPNNKKISASRKALTA